jgi:EmrB/QacA subfamily drug resistance transporter
VDIRDGLEAESRPPTRREFRVVLGGLMLALTLAALDQNIVATALPRIVSDLGGLAHLSWVVTAFLVASTTTTPLYGKFSDIYGRKPAFMVSIIIFLLGSVLCGLAQGMTQLIVFRAIQGIGAGGLITLAQTTIGDLVSPRDRGRYQGLFAAVFAGCSVAGPLLGGFITDALSWRWIFYVNLPVGAVALILIAVGLRKHRHAGTHRIDYAGALLLIAATCCALLVLSWGGSVYPWTSAPILIIGAAAVLLCAALALVEARAAEPVLPLHLFTNRVFVLGVTVISLSAMALFAAVVFLPAGVGRFACGCGVDDLPDDGRRDLCLLSRGAPGLEDRSLQAIPGGWTRRGDLGLPGDELGRCAWHGHRLDRGGARGDGLRHWLCHAEFDHGDSECGGTA